MTPAGFKPKAPEPSMYVSPHHLGDTDLWHLWKAIAKPSGEPVLVKVARDGMSLDAQRLIRLLTQSTEIQRPLDIRLIVTPRRSDARPGGISIAYPFLSAAIWSSLTEDVFLEQPLACLIETVFVVDYLHHYRLVHGDLKLSNFMYCRTSRGIRLRLVDNDFMRSEFERSDAIILGTPSHVAPEILANKPPCVESDSYSFGRMLADLLVSLRNCQDKPVSAAQEKKLQALSEACVRSEVTARPRSLLQALLQAGLIEASEYQSLLRRLLGAVAAAQARTILQAGGSRSNLLSRLTREIRLFGLPETVLTELTATVQSQPIAVMRLWYRWLQRSTVERTPDYWRIDLPNDGLVAAYRLIHDDPGWPGSVASADGVVRLAQEADRLAGETDYLRAWLHLRLLLTVPDRAADQLSGGRLQRAAIRRWYDIISQVRQPQELIDGLAALYEHEGLPDDIRLHIGMLVVRCYLLMGRKDEVLSMCETLEAAAIERDEWSLRSVLVRQRCWAMVSLGQLTAAYESLTQLRDEALQRDDYVQVGHALIELMRLEEQTGNSERQLEHMQELERLARQHEVAPASLISMHQLRAARLFQQGRYHEAQRHARAGLKLSEEHSLFTVRPFLYEQIATANIRMARYDAAHRELTMSMADRCETPGAFHITTFLRGMSFLDISRGRYFDGLRSFRQARAYLDAASPVAQSRYWQIFAELACWQNDRERLAEAVRSGQKLIKETPSTGIQVELAGVAVLDKLHNMTEAVSADDILFINQLLKEQHFMFAARLLVLMLLYPDASIRQRARRLADSLSPDQRLDTSVVLGNLFDKMCRIDEADRERCAETLKESYILCNRTGTFDIGIALCRALAEHYAAADRTKVARRYYEAAAQHARDMGNALLIQRYERAAAALTVGPAVHTLLASVRSMSGILASLEDRQDAMQRLIRYAVDLTGAERGVLFDVAGDRLRPAAYISCDTADLKDITDFSHSIVKTSVGEARTVTIDNAVEDDRTSQYKSVIAHNIRAVICTPIIYDEHLLGALYLDHHNLPGLFTDDDIQLVETIANFLAVSRTTLDRMASLSATNENLRTRLRSAGYDSEFIGRNSRIQDMLSMLPRIAASTAPVLIIGETGTGKECLADMVHNLSPRAGRPMVKLNCASFAPTLIESELFGVAAGTATGVTGKPGKFEAADRGSLFLDEIGDMSLEVQAKVLRVLESQQFERVGSTKPIETDIRFIYATNQPLERLVEDGRFRRDLYYRLNTFVIEIPPLRKRRDDIPLLVEHFIRLLATGDGALKFSKAAMEQLTRYDWPGNVRQLKNFVDMMLILYPGTVIQPDHVRRHLERPEVAPDANPDDEERDRIIKALARHNWNQTRAAAALNLPLSTLRNRMKRFGLRRP